MTQKSEGRNTTGKLKKPVGRIPGHKCCDCSRFAASQMRPRSCHKYILENRGDEVACTEWRLVSERDLLLSHIGVKMYSLSQVIKDMTPEQIRFVEDYNDWSELVLELENLLQNIKRSIPARSLNQK